MERCINLTELREKYSLSMGKVAARLGVTPATIWQWEHKPVEELKPKAIKALKSVFPPAEVSLMINPDADVSGESWEMPTEEQPQDQPQETVQQPQFIIQADWRDAAEPEDPIKNELEEVYKLLSDSGKQGLLSYARYLYMIDRGVTFAQIPVKQQTQTTR